MQHRSTYQKPEWGIPDVFGKVDVVPSSIKYLRDLRNLQMTVYAEMLVEAQELLKTRDEIFQRVGVSQMAMAGSK